MEKDFLSMISMIIGVHNTVRTDILLNELGIRPLKYQWLKRMVSFWSKLVALPENHLYSKGFMLLWSHHPLTLMGGIVYGGYQEYRLPIPN